MNAAEPGQRIANKNNKKEEKKTRRNETKLSHYIGRKPTRTKRSAGLSSVVMPTTGGQRKYGDSE